MPLTGCMWVTTSKKVTVINEATRKPAESHDQKFAVGRLVRLEFHLPPTNHRSGSSEDRVTVVSHEPYRLEWVTDVVLPVVGIRVIRVVRVQWLSKLEGRTTRTDTVREPDDGLWTAGVCWHVADTI